MALGYHNIGKRGSVPWLPHMASGGLAGWPPILLFCKLESPCVPLIH